jgi:hypothetical protein
VAGAEKGKQGINTPFQPTLQSPSPSPCRCRLARFRGSLCMPRLGFRSLPIGQQVSISGLDHQLSQMTCSGKLLMNMTTIISRGGFEWFSLLPALPTTSHQPSLPLDYQRSTTLAYNIHTDSFISSWHKFFDFEFKQFWSYSNGYNKIILINYNLQYFLDFYEF